MADDQEFKKKLNPEQYRVMREKATENPFSGKYWDSEEKGIYACAFCGTALFSSTEKFDSGTGWPSFEGPIDEKNITLTPVSQPPLRMAVSCKKCNSHVGYVVDGVKKDTTYWRANSASMDFEELEDIEWEEEEEGEEEKKKKEEERKEQENAKENAWQNKFQILKNILLLLLAAAGGAAAGVGYCSVMDESAGMPAMNANTVISVSPASSGPASISSEPSPTSSIAPSVSVQPSSRPSPTPAKSAASAAPAASASSMPSPPPTPVSSETPVAGGADGGGSVSTPTPPIEPIPSESAPPKPEITPDAGGGSIPGG